MDLEQIQDEDLRSKIEEQLKSKGVNWDQLNEKQQQQIVRAAKNAKNIIKKMAGQ